MAKVRPLPDHLSKIAETELYEDSSRISESINLLRKWVLKQPHLKARIDDQFLLSFLRGCKHSVEKAKHKLDLYYTFRTALPDIYLNRDLSNPRIFELLRLGVVLELTTEEYTKGPTLTIVRLGAYNPYKYNFREILPMNSLITDFKHHFFDNFIIYGGMMLFDLANITAAHIFQLEPILNRKILSIHEKSTPYRNAGIHIINAPKGVDKIVNLIKNCISEKHRKRFYVHSRGEQTLLNHIPKEILPKEYGGELGTISDIMHYWEEKIRSHKHFYEEEKSYGTLENLRPGRPLTAEFLFGIDGTFRKLEID